MKTGYERGSEWRQWDLQKSGGTGKRNQGY